MTDKNLIQYLPHTTVTTLEWCLASVTTHVLLEVARMAKLTATIAASKPALVVVDEHVIVEAMLPSECGVANGAHKWLDA